MASITTAQARAKLEIRSAPYFNEIVRGELSLGYRKNVAGGNWVARHYLEKRQRIDDTTWSKARYATRNIGPADETLKGTLDYDRAEARARLWLRQQAAANGTKPITVTDAVESYVKWREAKTLARGGFGQKRDAAMRLARHVLGDARLANLPLEQLSEEDLAQWRASLAGKASRRGGLLSESAIRRTVNDFKAALNAAHRANRRRMPGELALVIKHGFKAATETKVANARQAQVLPDADVRALLAAAAEVDREKGWDGDLHRLVLVLAATGTRFSQAIRITVADVQVEQSRLMVPVSFKGQGGKAITHTAVRVGDDVIDQLRPALAGRKGNEPLLLRPYWKQVGPVEWELAGRAPWGSATGLVRAWGRIIAEAGLPTDLVPYCLRHSSIVRGLRAGLPVRLVAALHDTGSAMIEKHYAAYIVDAMDELAARAVVPLIAQPPSSLRPFHKRAGAFANT
jgi:integrase